MCGITGIASLNDAASPSAERVRAMCATLVHRGPDDESIDIQGAVALANRRLSVIDIEGGRQPLFNEDRSIRAVLNGEIYNFRELRQALERAGHRFRTASDTEVIVHAYEEYGEDFVNHLNGMFAIALHDERRRRLLLARDQLGIKPIYYTHTSRDQLLFGSEIKAILASGLIRPDLDMDSLGQFLSWEYVPGRRTLIRDVFELEPAEMLTVDLASGTMKRRHYWDIPPPGDREEPDWEEAVAETLDRCVKRQLVADVPLGAFLSGGVDSSLVLSATGGASAFSIGFEDSSYNELPHAERVAAHLGARHIKEVIREDAVDLFDTVMGQLDDPIADFSVFPTYQISRLARRHVTVALSGDGGDELFGGYETYAAERYAHWYQYLPSSIREKIVPAAAGSLRPSDLKKGLRNKFKRFVEGAAYPAELGHARWRLFAGDVMKQALMRPEALAEMPTPTGAHIRELYVRAGERSGLDRQLYVDVRSYLSDNCLVKVDRMSMASSLEVRVPLLDRELVELAFRVPADEKVRGGETKAILKRIAASRIPRECVYRQKEGFSIPMKHWLAGQFRPIMEHYLSPARVREEGLFVCDQVENLKREHLAGSHNHSHLLWSLIVFQAWKDRWLQGAS